MSNILNHNRHILQFDLVKENYWDFHLAIDTDSNYYPGGLTERCLSTYINLSDDECIWFDNIYSKEHYTWENAVNTNTLEFENFGYTSVDNGKTYYEKDKISNDEFYKIFTTTVFKPDIEDVKLSMAKVKGNQQLYDYTNDISVWHDEIQSAKLNGGWYQGFFCANDGSEYKTLPTDLGTGWSLEFVLNKEDFTNDKQTLNDIYPENKGIFFYIGTRAENKWWIKYLTNHNFDWCKKNGFSDDYADSEYSETDIINEEYFKQEPKDEEIENNEYFADGYMESVKQDNSSAFSEEYMKEPKCADCDNCSKQYVKDEYYEKDMTLNDDMELNTSEGYNMYQPNISEIKTDNKFVIFDRTKEGMTADKWNNNTDVILHYIKKPNIGNYFELLHHACGGYDVKKIEELINIKNKEYNVLNDIYRNAFALQIKDDGTIGYKYLIKDCDSEEENYKIESEFTNNSVIVGGKWYTVHVKIIPIKHKDKSVYKCLQNNSINDTMRIIIYVNGKVVLISKLLPIFNFKKLNDLESKQEGVPFNISLGGGTQGLAETVYLNYMKLPEYVLPLEKEFGGSFIGWIKSFLFYSCPLNYTEIVSNYDFNRIV